MHEGTAAVEGCETSARTTRTDVKEDIVTSTLAPTELTAADRCDRCGAQAYIRARLTTGGELLFCAHHGRAHLDKLKDIAVAIDDQTDRLHADETPSV